MQMVVLYLNFARIFTNHAKAFASESSMMGSLLEKIQVIIFGEAFIEV